MKPQPYKTVLGIDIGGTKIDLGLVSDGQVIQKHNFKIGDLNDRKSLLDGLVSAINGAKELSSPWFNLGPKNWAPTHTSRMANNAFLTISITIKFPSNIGINHNSL